MTATPRDPVTVTTGVLTAEEFAKLSPEDRASAESTTIELLEKYGEAFFVRERDRLRAEIRIAY
jgi:hypothetical protein